MQRVCQYWLQEFRFDGYRFDLSKGFTQRNSGNDVGAWGSYDASRITIWKRIYDQIRSYDKSAYVILEHFADNREEKELADYGMLLWGNHSGDLRSLARNGTGNVEGISYKNRNFQHPNLIGYVESHDEERILFDLKQNGAIDGSYSVRDLNTALDRSKLVAAFMLSVPGPRLIWQFGELGYDLSINTCSDGTTINDGCRTAAKPVRWAYAQDTQRLKLFKVYSEFIKLKLTVPAFSTTEFVMDFTQSVKRLTLPHPTGTAFLIGNFDTKPLTVKANFPAGGKWYHYFSGQEINVTDPSVSIMLEPGAFHLYTTLKLATPEAGLVPFSVVPGLVTAVTEEPASSLVVSPNPTTDEVTVDLSSNYRGLITMRLFDLGGREMQNQSIQKSSQQLRHSIGLRQLPDGLYYLHIRQGQQKTVKKVLKR